MLATGSVEPGGGRHPRQTSPTDKQGLRAFIGRLRGELHAETAQSSLTVIFKLVISGLTSSILVVLGTVNLQFLGASQMGLVVKNLPANVGDIRDTCSIPG